MNTYKPNLKGIYPSCCGNTKSKIALDDTRDAILYLMNRNIRKKRLRDLISDVYEYLQKNEAFHYGVSEGCNLLIASGIPLTSNNVTLDHAVPNTLVVKKLKNSGIKSRKLLLDFLKDHYFLCLITKTEDGLLNQNGLRQKMPASWNNNWNNWKCRYDTVGITLAVGPGS